MRNPNGYGSIVKLSGNRRRPYCVRKAVTQWNDKGYPVYEVIGYFATKKEAMQTLAEYNTAPYDLKRDKITFADVYYEWCERKYPEISSTLAASYTVAFKRLEAVHDVPVVQLRTPQLQDLIDSMDISAVLKRNMRLVLKMVIDYAAQNDIVTKNVAAFLKTPPIQNAEKHPFTPEELQLLWDNSTVPGVDDIIIMIYTGWRIQEYCTLRTADIDLEEGYMKGGMKTEAGKGRIVPIHHRIMPLVKAKFDPSSETFVKMPYPKFRREFAKVILALGLDHTAHETRHTFVSMLDNAGANPVTVKRLVGHTSKDITSKVYIHKDLEQLKETIELLP